MNKTTRKIKFTEVWRTLVGDVGSIRRVFDFLENWGLINYFGSISKTQLKREDKDAKPHSKSSANTSSVDIPVPKKRVCSGCKSLLGSSFSCFVCDKFDMILCERCYVRGNYMVGLKSSDFRRVELSKETKTDWNEKETFLLLEGVMHFGDDWKKVAGHVGGRSEKECVSHFIKLPFGEQFYGPTELAEMDCEQVFTKRMKLTPLVDSSNPIRLSWLRCVVSGSGKIAMHVLEKLISYGAISINVSDSKGVDEEGFDFMKISFLRDIKAQHRSLRLLFGNWN